MASSSAEFSVKLLNGDVQTYPLAVEYATVGDLVCAVRAALGPDYVAFRLGFKGKIWAADATLAAAGIGAGAKLWMTPSPNADKRAKAVNRIVRKAAVGLAARSVKHHVDTTSAEVKTLVDARANATDGKVDSVKGDTGEILARMQGQEIARADGRSDKDLSLIHI